MHLKSMNVTGIAIGFETGSESNLFKIKKGSVTIQQNKNALKLAKKYGLNVYGFFMIGAPNETMGEMLETHEFIKKNLIDVGQISVMIPFPEQLIFFKHGTILLSLISHYR